MIYTDFDLNALKIFVAVFENGSIDLASKKMFITQPAVSIAIKKLEERLGGKLFVRLPKGTKPTEEGIRFYAYCKNALKQIENGIRGFSFEQASKGTLRIGASPSIIKLLMPSIATFCQTYPNVKLAFTEVIASRLQKYLLKGEIDLALMEEPFDTLAYDTHAIATLHPCFVGAKNTKSKWSMEELLACKFATLKPLTSTRAMFDKVCAQNNLPIKPSYEMANTQTLAEFCTHGLCLGFAIKEYVTEQLNNHSLQQIQTPLTLLAPITLFAVLPKGSTGGLMGQKFLELLKNKPV